ncbi:Gfo/Idh/MocA family oxidoreductase [Halomonas sp. H5]|uniref:Gfo/Idh/MocA family oxidoreductase n=1 Tax=Halomonas sp. H5 TaxID=3423910 RepID=UPI003D36AD8F
MSIEKHFPTVRWGILGAARIAKEHVIPAMHASQHGQSQAIVARDQDRASKTTKGFDILTTYGFYEALLSAPDIDAGIFRCPIICTWNMY